MKKGLSQEIISRIEFLESTNIFDALQKRYFEEMLSYRKLSILWKINNRTVAKVISYCNTQARQGSDAVKTQWINNEARRRQSAEIIANINHNLALKGLHVRQGKNKQNSKLIRDIAEKLKITSSFHRPEVLKKAVENSIKTRMKHPERNAYLKTAISRIEQLAIDFFKSKNINFEFRYIVKGYFVNFYLPDYHLLIDLQGSNRFPLSFKRHQTIQNEGFTIVYCIHYFVEKSNLTDLYNYITHIDTLRSNPTHTSKKSVIWGARNLFPFGKECYEVAIERIRMDGFHKLHITTTTN